MGVYVGYVGWELNYHNDSLAEVHISHGENIYPAIFYTVYPVQGRGGAGAYQLWMDERWGKA